MHFFKLRPLHPGSKQLCLAAVLADQQHTLFCCSAPVLLFPDRPALGTSQASFLLTVCPSHPPTYPAPSSPFSSHTQVTLARQSLIASYPDPVLQNPNGWRVGAKTNSTIVVATNADSLKVFNQAQAGSKLAPAIALASTNTLSSGPTTAITTVEATGRPGLQYGVVLAKADQQMVNTGEIG